MVGKTWYNASFGLLALIKVSTWALKKKHLYARGFFTANLKDIPLGYLSHGTTRLKSFSKNERPPSAPEADLAVAVSHTGKLSNQLREDLRMLYRLKPLILKKYDKRMIRNNLSKFYFQ